MWIKPQRSWQLPESAVTDEALYLQRRQFLQGAVGVMGLAAWPNLARATPTGAELAFESDSPFSSDERWTSYESITTYNNFYEFGTDKGQPAQLAANFPPADSPWMIRVDGACEAPGEYDFDAFVRGITLEERIYRLRCVEAWSMVVPWIGFPLSSVLARARPTSQAKFVEFTTLYNPEWMPGQRRRVVEWPYVESLRIDEAMHPLTLLSVGLYGRVLPGQNGAPIRLVVPWKYGFKSIKSIVRIRFTETPTRTTWMKSAPNEYGFYANVNPQVDHPRWSQKRERRIGELLKRETLMFNGYAEQVADLYQGMDLRRYF